ncbi:stage V sporulation protein B [Dethiosulfatibacter aminovorans DSM 17477]|uniref:Stage V sporulation protein B n=1 Tax=Dethiosulfatibacter aminovorans DSM 17477 TaxID=1121476 RepID=A0A1M6JGB3_9FIRM|nr:polysaccharide biosynthesis protein [Dethiosulfatibacter aminovorans]SHJ45731.1 stage V sporulation protein B [Dethiosulfatibacter aminovorans DSM 17477]
MSGKNFLKGAAVLGMAGLIVKIIGAIYRIPLTNLIGTEGIGYYQPAYQVYNLLLVISLAGFPTAIARLVSEKRALDNPEGAHQIFKISMKVILVISILSSLVIFIFAQNIANSIGYPGTYYSLLALVPALFIVPVMSVYRGYFQGMQNMVPTAMSQVIEQLVRFATGLSLAYILVDKGLPEAAGGASFGASAGGIAGFLLIFFIYFRNRKTIKGNIASAGSNSTDESKRVVKRLLTIAVPITLGASIVPLMGLIDAKLVSMRLLQIGYTVTEATDLYGQLSGTAQTFINFPQVFSIAIAMSLVPSISEAFTVNDMENLNHTASLGTRTALIIGLPSAVGLYILSEPIIALFYPALGPDKHVSVGQLLAILAVSVVFLTLVQSLTAILQAVEKQRIPVKNLAIGAVVKIVLTYILVGIPALNVKGAAISTIAAYLTAALLNYFDLNKYTDIHVNILKVTVRPFIASAIMGAMVYGVYTLAFGVLGMKMAALASIAVGIAVYAVALPVTGTITGKDMDLLPKGEKIYSIMKKIKLMK